MNQYNNNYNQDLPPDNSRDIHPIIENLYGEGSDHVFEDGRSAVSKVWKFLIIMVIIIAILLIALFLVGSYFLKEDIKSKSKVDLSAFEKSSSLTQNPQRLIAENKDRPMFGNIDAPLVIVQFGDFQCEKSQQEYSQIRQAVLKNKDNVLLIFRNLPVIDSNSSILAKAGLCANEQDKFWQFHDKIYANQKNLSVDMVREMAITSGIDIEKFSVCLNSAKYDDALQKDIDDAGALGVIGTPTFFVNGNKLEGVISASDWDRIINKSEEIFKSK